MPEPVDRSQGDSGRTHEISPKMLWSTVEIPRDDGTDPATSSGLSGDALAAAFAGMSDAIEIDAAEDAGAVTSPMPAPQGDDPANRPTKRRHRLPKAARLGIAAGIACAVAAAGVVVGLNLLSPASPGGEKPPSSQGGTETGGSRTSGDTGTRVARGASRQDEGEDASEEESEETAKDEGEQQPEGDDKKDAEQGDSSKDEKQGESPATEGGNAPAGTAAPTEGGSKAAPADTGGGGGGAPVDNGSYTIMFDANGGSCESQSRQVGNGMAVGSLPVARRDYHTFTGWFCNGSEVGSGTVLAPSATHTLVAHWAENRVSDWVRASDAPGGAQVTERKWTYKQTTYKSVPSSYTYYRWCSHYDNTWNQDSCWINNTSVYHELTVPSPMNACPNKFPDKGGNAAGLHGPYGTCEHKREGQSYWWLKHTNYSNVVDRVDSRESDSYPSQGNVSEVTEWVRYRSR